MEVNIFDSRRKLLFSCTADDKKTALLKALQAKCDLRGANFSNDVLDNMDLRGAEFLETNFEGANFTGTNLVGARFEKTRLVAAVFNSADLSRSFFRDADIRCVDFTRANLRGATFENSKLQGSLFEKVETDEATHVKNDCVITEVEGIRIDKLVMR